MSKLDDLLEKYKNQLEKAGASIDENLLRKVARGCGPAIYRADASLVSTNDPEEVARVKNNFLIKKLGLSESDNLDSAIEEVANQVGKSNPSKYRVVFYYLLTKKFGKENIYS